MKQIILKIEGMTCSACSSGLEKYLNKQEGIVEVNVNLILSIATIKYENITIKEIEEHIKNAGFKSKGEFTGINYENNQENSKSLIIMGIILIITMLLSFIHSMTNLSTIVNNPIIYNLILFIINIIFLIYGKDIIINGFKSLINKIPNMDTLVLLSVTTNFLYSIYSFINLILNKNNLNIYFETTCMVIYFVKLGRFIENKSKNKTKNAIQELVQITPKTATIKKDDEEIIVSIDEIKIDDIIICKPGEKIAVDGVIISGQTHLDESFITGESNPTLKGINDKVIAGSINYDGKIEYLAKKIGINSTISEIVKLVIESTNIKNKIGRIADKFSSYFVYLVISIAIITLTINLAIDNTLSESIQKFTTILVVACPCSLGLAVPLVVVVANGICAKHGLFIRNSEILEKAKNINTIVFDKTGTLTHGKLKIYKLYNYSKYHDDKLLNIVSNIESLSTHPIKTAFKIKEKIEVKNFSELSGVGLKATIDKQEYYLANDKILDKLNIKNNIQENVGKLTNHACSIIYIIENKKIIGLIGIKDTIKENAKKVVQELKNKNIEVVMLTGDNEKTANIIAKNLNINKVYANVLPKDKSKIIKNIQKEGKTVIMTGDGINDAIALVDADIGISIASGTDIANYSSDVILMNNNLENILKLIKLSQKSSKIIIENLSWTFIYNTIMIGIATGLFNKIGIELNPMIASISMTISSLTVVFNSLKLGRIKL